MQVGDYVSFQAGLDRHIEFGTLVSIDPKEETGTINAAGKLHVRALGRIRTAGRGLKEQAARDRREYKRWKKW